ncbi:MAG TPA: Hsp70 family protein [Microlunatus sp.]
MAYSLGIDLGTTYTAAAVSDGRHAEVVPLGDRSPQAPSVIYKTPEGAFRYGESAERHAATEPERIAREFKRRMGDQTPIFVAGTPMSAHACSKALLGWAIEQVVAGQGEPPDRVIVTCPANWGPYRRELMSQVTALNADYPITVCTEPEAAALHFVSSRRMIEDRPIAVYDLGGGTFDAAVLRRAPSGGFDVVGTPDGLEQLGGIDFDEAVFERVGRGIDWDRIDPDEPDTLTGLARLRRDCTEAKESLSSETEAVVPILLGGRLNRVRLTRAEFNELIGPLVGDTLEILDRVIRRSGVAPSDLGAIVLVGGSSRVPLISERITQRFGRPAVLSPQPKLCVAMGAALIGADPEIPSTSAMPAAPAAAPRTTPAGPAAAPKPAVEPLVIASTPPTPPAGTAVVTSQETASSTEVGRPTTVASPLPRSTPAEDRGDASRARGRRPVPVYRVISGLCALAAILLMTLAPQPADFLTWDKNFAVDATKQLPDARLTVTLFGIDVPGGSVPITSPGIFDLQGSRVFLAGPVRGTITVAGGDQDVVLEAADRWNWKRWLSLPFAALVLTGLFSFAYTESIVGTLRRRKRRATPGELLGLVGSGLGLGVAAALTAWVIGDRLLDPAAVLGIVVFVCAAVGLLAFAWRPPEDAPSS